MIQQVKRATPLDFEIDKLTHSIEDVATGESFKTKVIPIVKGDLKDVTKKNGWNFNWKSEYTCSNRKVFKLITEKNSDLVHGLLCISKEPDHVFMHLLENAPFNIGKNKLYHGVAGNLVAYACTEAFQYGFEGCVGFTAKTKLIPHYEQSLGAIHIGGHRMIIETPQAQFLIDKYYK